MFKGKPLRISELRCFTQIGRLFCMMTGYLDESANNETIVCGGWIATDRQWDKIIPAWRSRIAYENRVSAKHDLPPITRYHANYCANLKKEFKGWTIKRQIAFAKTLQDIMAARTSATKCTKHERPVIFGWGMSTAEFKKEIIPKATDAEVKHVCYTLCAIDCLKGIGQAMEQYYPSERITFIHDRGDLAVAAQQAFEAVREKYPQFVGLMPGGWEDFIPLQPADMVAYDLFKRISKRYTGVDQVRRSLQRLVAQGTPIIAGHLKPGAMKDIAEMMERNGFLNALR
jgi:hypothetical protein